MKNNVIQHCYCPEDVCLEVKYLPPKLSQLNPKMYPEQVEEEEVFRLFKQLQQMPGTLLLIDICYFHVLSHLLLIYICKLHWNRYNARGPPSTGCGIDGAYS